jgi:hypothetical protein
VPSIPVDSMSRKNRRLTENVGIKNQLATDKTFGRYEILSIIVVQTALYFVTLRHLLIRMLCVSHRSGLYQQECLNLLPHLSFCPLFPSCIVLSCPTFSFIISSPTHKHELRCSVSYTTGLGLKPGSDRSN